MRSGRHSLLADMEARHFHSRISTYWADHGLAVTATGARLDSPLIHVLDGADPQVLRTAQSAILRYGDARFLKAYRLVLGDFMLRSVTDLRSLRSVGPFTARRFLDALAEVGAALRPAGAPLRIPPNFPFIRVSADRWGHIPVVIAAQMVEEGGDIADVSLLEASALSVDDLRAMVPEADLPHSFFDEPEKDHRWLYESIQASAARIDRRFFADRVMEQTMSAAAKSPVGYIAQAVEPNGNEVELG